MPITLNGTTGEVFPSWTTAGRPTSPVAGQTGYNTTLGALESYNSTTTTWIVSGSNPKITQTIYTTGSGTYTVPTGVTWLRVRMVGGGGGGSGGGSGSPGTGGTGGTSSLGSILSCTGGSSTGQVTSTQFYGVGTINSPATGIAISGAVASSNAVSSTGTASGGSGGVSPFGGNGFGGWGTGTGQTAVANSGSGGGGGGNQTTSGYIGAGGTAGGYVDAIISSPSATYSYAIGAGGTAGAAGTSGGAGGAGGSGYIIIEEHYNW